MASSPSHPRPLIITADNKARIFGIPNPPFTASYNGFVNGDTPASLNTPVILTTSASSISPVGYYTINAAGPAHPTTPSTSATAR